MTDSVVIRKESYIIEQFTQLQLASVIDGYRTIRSFQSQNEIGAFLKEVAIPTLPNTLVNRKDLDTGRSFYVLYLEIDEIESIFLKLIEVAKERKLLPEDGEIVTVTPIDEKDQQIEQLQKEIALLKKEVK